MIFLSTVGQNNVFHFLGLFDYY